MLPIAPQVMRFVRVSFPCLMSVAQATIEVALIDHDYQMVPGDAGEIAPKGDGRERIESTAAVLSRGAAAAAGRFLSRIRRGGTPAASAAIAVETLGTGGAFVLTCVSTFAAGAHFFDHWFYHLTTPSVSVSDGIMYSSALMLILLCHEMGHYLQARRLA